MLYVSLFLLVPLAAVVWLVWCGGRWRTAGFVLGHLIVAVVVFSVIATVVAESEATVCYNGPCTEHTAALLGGAAGLVLTVICVLAALAALVAWRRKGRSTEDRRPLRLRPWLVACDALALGALAAGAVVYGNHLGDSATSEASRGVQPALRSSHVTHARYGRQASLSSASFASSGSSSSP
jgi:hypothetical protein